MSYQIPEEYDLFLDRLLEEAHPNGLSDELKTEMKTDLYGRLENYLLTSFIQALPNEISNEFDQLMSSIPNQSIVQKFFQENIPNIEQVSVGALLEFKDVYLGATNHTKEI